MVEIFSVTLLRFLGVRFGPSVLNRPSEQVKVVVEQQMRSHERKIETHNVEYACISYPHYRM